MYPANKMMGLSQRRLELTKEGIVVFLNGIHLLAKEPKMQVLRHYQGD